MPETTALYEVVSLIVVARDEAGNTVELAVDGPLDKQQSKVSVTFDYQDHPEEWTSNDVDRPTPPTTSILSINLRLVKHSYNATKGVMLKAIALGKHRKSN